MSQVNFLMMPADEADFLDAVFSRPDTLVVLGKAFDTPSPPPASREELVNASGITAFTFLHRALTSAIGERPASDGCYRFHMFHDAHIDFDRCRIAGDVLASGRIYAKIGWLTPAENNHLFRSWYGAIERWIKKRYSQLDGGWWIGPSAESWSRDGGRLAHGGTLARKVSLDGPCHQEPNA